MTSPYFPERGILDAAAQARYPKTAWPCGYHPILMFGSKAPGANAGCLMRVAMPDTGTINALAVFVVVSNGNLDLGVYDTNITTRARLASTGSTAVGAANNWQSVAISLAVTAGQQLDLAVSVSGTASFGANATANNPAVSQLPSGWMTVPGGGAPFVAASVAAIFPLPATILESGMSTIADMPFIMARYA